LRIVLEP
jgi:midasin